MVHLAFNLAHRVSSLIMRSAYGEAQGCSMQGQQCYCHLLTRYLIFKNVLIVYGIILESMCYLMQCVYTGYIDSWILSSLYIL